MKSTSLYIHIPFCKRRCGYCDFNTFAGMETLLQKYVDALCQEIGFLGKTPIDYGIIGTIFFGGGTPSLLSIGQFQQILATVTETFAISDYFEMTLEANPGSVGAEYLAGLHAIGFNRISFGMQSAHPHDLRILDRQHSHEDIINAVAWSKKAGFKSINLDLIFGIPTQSLQRWQSSMALALAENIDHFSLYSLAVEDGTPLKSRIDRGLLDPPDDDLAAEMYADAMQVLEMHEYRQYEISNWARVEDKDHRCRHNLQYWRMLPYLGIGAGAHGFFNAIRTENTGSITDYIKRIDSASQSQTLVSPACISQASLSKWELAQEYMMVGLRLTEEGVSETEFYESFELLMRQVFARQLDFLFKRGLLERHPTQAERIRLTKKGRFFGNQVFAQFVGNPHPDNSNSNNL